MAKPEHILLLLDWYDYRIHRGVARVARQAGWHLICPKNALDMRRILEGWRGDGCILLTDADETMRHFHQLDIPVVSFGLNVPDLPVWRVVTDNWEIGRLAAEYFIDRGYREVVAPHPGDSEMLAERLAALTHHMEAGGGGGRPAPPRGGPVGRCDYATGHLGRESGAHLGGDERCRVCL